MASRELRWAQRYRAIHGPEFQTVHAPSMSITPRSGAQGRWAWVIAACAVTVAASGLIGFGLTWLLPLAGSGGSLAPATPTVGRAVAQAVPVQTTVKDAQRRVGFRPLTLATYRPANLQGVLYWPAQANSNTKPGSPAAASVELDYVVNGASIQLIESRGPFHLQPTASQLQGLPMHTETINGGQFLVLRSADQTRILLITSSAPPGLVVSLNALPAGIDTQTANILIQHVA
jgi:hypothetical protein